MRLDRLREGLLGPGPLVPGATTDIRPYPYTAPAQTPNVTEAISDPKSRAMLSFLQSVSPINPYGTTELAQGMLRGAMSGGVQGPPKSQPSPAMQATLSELSDITQGRRMGPAAPVEPDEPEDDDNVPMTPEEIEIFKENLKPGPLQQLRYRNGGFR